MLTSLSNFPAIQEVSALRNMDPGEVKAMHFYKTVTADLWYWTNHLEEHVKRGFHAWSEVAGGLKMAGVSSVLYAQEMLVKQDKDDEILQYDVLLRAQCEHGYHNQRKFMDTCLT